MRTILSFLVILLALFSFGCNDPLKTTSKALSDTATAVGQLQTTVINANKQGLLSDADTSNILQICGKVNQAGLEASRITRSYTQLTPQNKADLGLIIDPLIIAVNDSLSNGLVTVKDPNTRQTIQLALTAIKTALVTVQAVVRNVKQPTALWTEWRFA